MPPRFPAIRQHLESNDLERKREKIFQPIQVPVFFVEQDQDFLRQILGSIPLHSRCRKAHDPFAQLAQDLLARAGRLSRLLAGRMIPWIGLPPKGYCVPKIADKCRLPTRVIAGNSATLGIMGVLPMISSSGEPVGSSRVYRWFRTLRIHAAAVHLKHQSDFLIWGEHNGFLSQVAEAYYACLASAFPG